MLSGDLDRIRDGFGVNVDVDDDDVLYGRELLVGGWSRGSGLLLCFLGGSERMFLLPHLFLYVPET